MAALPVLGVGQDLALRGGVTPELVRDDHARGVPQALRRLAEEPLGRFGAAPALHQDVEHTPVPVHGAPERVRLAAGADEHLIRVPFVARPWTSALRRVGEHLAEAQAPRTDALVTGCSRDWPRRRGRPGSSRRRAGSSRSGDRTTPRAGSPRRGSGSRGGGRATSSCQARRHSPTWPANLTTPSWTSP